jgi:putative ABC transport system permease protein
MIVVQSFKRFRSLFQKNRMEREMEREMRFHIARETERNIQRGLKPKDARRAALRDFGGVERIKEECRDVSRLMWLEALWQDIRYSTRSWRRNPGYTLVAVLTLALGIGANTAIFSLIYGVLLRPLPYQNGTHLVVLRQQAPLAGRNNPGFSVKEIEDYREQTQTLDQLAEHHSMSFTLLGAGEPELIQTGVVSANFFDLLGVRPLYGRTFLPADEGPGAEAVLVLSFNYWQRSQGGDPNVVGKVFKMNDRTHTVIGVLPSMPQYPNENDVYMTTAACPTRSSERFKLNRNARMMSVFGRLKPEANVEQAQADVAAIASRLQQQYPDSYPANQGHSATAQTLKKELTEQARPTFLLLLGTAGFVLFIACSNVANLTLARMMRREREFALRAALGASRKRLIQQLLTESTMLALLGGGLGILLAAFSLDLLVDFAARFTTRASEISLDGSVLLFTFVIAVTTGVVFGLMPVLSAKENLVTGLKEGGAQSPAKSARNRLRSLLVVAQVAVSFMLLIGAGLMLKSFGKLQQVNLGYNPEKVLVMRVNANWSRYNTQQLFRSFSLRVLDKIQQQPGVISAAMSNNYPLNPLGISFGPFNTNFIIEGRPVIEGEIAPRADYRVASADYFQTIRLPVVQGRVFTDGDTDKAAPVAAINQTLARHRFEGENPIGKRISFDNGETWITVVGVVGDAKHYGLNRDATDEVYRPIAQASGASFLLVRTIAEPETIISQTRNAIYELDAETAIDRIQTLEDARAESISSPRLTAVLLTLFAVLALVITAAGIAGVMALSVTQRRHELGIRLALGATRSNVLWLVLRQGMALVFIGLALGSIGALALTRWLSTLLFAVEPTDPLTFISVSVVLAAAAAIACFIPARRVTGIDPMIALRSE